jgi:hypothetical protein
MLKGFEFFLKRSPGDELSPPEFSFHRCRASREVEERDANPDTMSSKKYNGEEGEITTATTTLSRNNNKTNNKTQG